MKMTAVEFDGVQPPIDAYAAEGFRIAGRFVEGPVILSAAGVSAWDGVDWTRVEAAGAAATAASLDAAAAASLAALAGAVDVVLIGVGREIAPAPADFRAALDAASVRYDVIGTPAACRTYNVLLTEERRVAAALLPVG